MPCLYDAQSCRGVPEPNITAKRLQVLSDGLCLIRALTAKALEMGLLHGQNLPPPGITVDQLRMVRGVSRRQPAMAPPSALPD